jgi:hypothetical protein
VCWTNNTFYILLPTESDGQGRDPLKDQYETSTFNHKKSFSFLKPFVVSIILKFEESFYYFRLLIEFSFFKDQNHVKIFY